MTRKTTRGVAAYLKIGARLRPGSVDARRDRGHARDYVEAMGLILQQPMPSDYVIGTGISRSVRDPVELAFGLMGLDWRDHVDLDPVQVGPTEVRELLAEPSKANWELGWYPRISFETMIRAMLESDLRAAGLDPEQYIHAVPMPQSRPT